MSNVQEEWTEAEFNEFTADRPGLAALKAHLNAQGFNKYLTSGRIEDEDGNRLDFGAFEDAEGLPGAVVLHCRDGECVEAVASIKGEDVEWSDASGNPVAVREVAVPSLLRRTIKQDPSQGSVLETALSIDDPVDPSDIDLTRRRLIVANQFGNAFGLPGGFLADTLSSGGLFTEVVIDDFLTPQALQGYLATAYPHEVLVVLSQSLRQLYRDSGDIADRWYRTLGIEVQRGIYGFDLVNAGMLGGALDMAPLSGPGVVLWVGGESLGDGTEGMTDNPDSMYTNVARPGKVVAGFVHSARPEVLMEAAGKFLAMLGENRTAGSARDEVNGYLDAWGVDARLAFAIGSDEEFKLTPAPADFWGERVPRSGIISPFMILRPWCTPPGGKEYALDEREGNPWVADLQFDGPVFRGSRDFPAAPEITLHLDMLGVLGEIREGAHFYFVFRGGLKTEFPDVTLYANAEITDVKEGPDQTVISFKGTAEAISFVSASGEDCTFKYMLLESLIGGTGKSSELTLQY